MTGTQIRTLVAVLKALQDNQWHRTSDLSKTTGLAPATVRSISKKLKEIKVVECLAYRQGPSKGKRIICRSTKPVVLTFEDLEQLQ